MISRRNAATLLASLFLVVVLLPGMRANGAPTPDQIEFFEKKIRPLLVDHCYSCHSATAEKIKGGLRLDTREAWMKGGESGPAIVPGDPDASRLIKAVRYTDPDLRMPPKNKKLSDEEIRFLEDWIRIGAPDPRDSTTAPGPKARDSGKTHWAFQPVSKPAVPNVKLSRWVQTPVDNFVLALLEKRKLQPSPAADRRTLIRRVTYDLIGLPPTYEEVEAFVHDSKPDAYARLVERLLASPHYGERWARYWLDVARFADTKGYLAGGEERRYAFSFTYRDYVVEAFNADKPYNQFLIEQIAADKLPLGEDRRPLAALGFLTLGRRFLNNQNDIIDDRIDVVSRGTLGLTVACARCHDHKFDPISSKDYYALHGVFASSEEPAELPLLEPLHEESTEYQDYLKEKAKIEAEIPEYKAREVAKFLAELRQHAGDYLLGTHEAQQLQDQSKFDTFAGEHKLNPAVLRRWIRDLESRRKNRDAVLGPWFDLEALDGTNFSGQAELLIARWKAAGTNINPIVLKALSDPAVASLKETSERYNQLFQKIEADWKEQTQTTNQAVPKAFGNTDQEALRQVLYAEGAPANVPQPEAESILARKLGEGTAPFRNRIQALGWTHAGAPKRAMALADRAHPSNSHVLLRGNPGNPGEEVPRRFLTILSGSERPPFTNGSGRLELARAIATPDNPLTARVYANRIWLHHFGEALVGTPGDFGLRTELPVHHLLLDYLAASLTEHGWSTKHLHRLILLSATYQQSSYPLPPAAKPDPDNRLWSHVAPQRLDFEAMRDTLLAAAGRLDPKLGGLPVQIDAEPFPTRRTLYALVDRQNLPALFRTFDFANPDVSSQGRFHTTIPQQALFLMNSPFVIEQARALARRPDIKAANLPADKIQLLYRITLQRQAHRLEVERAEQFMASQPATGSALSPLEKYAQVLLLSNELMFVD